MLIKIKNCFIPTITIRLFFFILDEEQLRTEPDVHLVFELKVKCIRNTDAPKDCANPEIMYLNHKGNFKFYFGVTTTNVSFSSKNLCSFITPSE